MSEKLNFINCCYYGIIEDSEKFREEMFDYKLFPWDGADTVSFIKEKVPR